MNRVEIKTRGEGGILEEDNKETVNKERIGEANEIKKGRKRGRKMKRKIISQQ